MAPSIGVLQSYRSILYAPVERRRPDRMLLYLIMNLLETEWNCAESARNELAIKWMTL